MTPVDILVGPDRGWSTHELPGGTLRFKGHLHVGMDTLEGAAAARHVFDVVAGAGDDAALKAALATIHGHHAFVLETPARVIAGVDRIRSSALLHATHHGRTVIDNQGRRLAERLGLGRDDHDKAQVLALSMAGYTIGDGTLHASIRQLRPGEALVIDATGTRTLRWFVYDAWNVAPKVDAEGEMDALLAMLAKRLARAADGRRVAAPLSAGLDSRFVASGLKMAGHDDIVTFSYGRPGNHEAVAAKAIAERLGLPWHFVPFTDATQRAMYADPSHARHWAEVDSLTSVPFVQDWTAIRSLQASGVIDPDTIVVNGNSGDYISGAHAPVALIDADTTTHGPKARERAAIDAVVAKHFRLWEAMATPTFDAVIADALAREARLAGCDFSDGQHLHGIHEMLEFQDRQSKYVVSGQRTYESLGLAWRLPLWDDEIIEFFRNAAPELKRGQALYRRSLARMNWGGAWRDIPLNAKTITPAWIRPIRFAAKLALAPLGPRKWHRFERRAFTWWMDPLRASVIVPYGRALADKAGARHAVAWIADAYLARHGVDTEHIGA